MAIEIVKPAVDVGLQTNRIEEHRRFWTDEVGLRFDHLLKVGGGIHQYRYDLHGAVLKCNSHRDPLDPAAVSGFTRLTTIGAVDEPTVVVTPDGTEVTVVAELPDGLYTVVDVEASDGHATQAALVALGAVPHADGARVGETLLRVLEVTGRPPTGRRDGIGIGYLTVQVRDVHAAHAHALEHGLAEGMAPLRLGDVAAISFVRLPDGDWIELSQRASLVGELPG